MWVSSLPFKSAGNRGVFLWRAAKAVYSLRTENVKLVGFCLIFTALLSLAYQGVCSEETILLAYMIVHVFVTILCTLVQLLKLLRTDRALLSYCKATRSITIKEDDPM